MVGCDDVYGGEAARAKEVLGQRTIIDRFIHADVEGLLTGGGVIEGEQNGRDEIINVDEIAFDRLAGGVEHDGDGSGAAIFFGAMRFNQITPARATENIVTEGKLIFEVVFFHDPRGAQAAAIEVVLNVILFEHDFFEDFGEGVTTGIGGMFLGFGDGDRMGVDEMPHAGITTDEDELLEGGAGAGGFQEPEHAFDGDIHDVLRGFFAGGEVENVGDSVEGLIDNGLIRQ